MNCILKKKIAAVIVMVGTSGLIQPTGIAHAQEAETERTDLSILHEIKQEAFVNSQVMDNLFYISDVYGPRLTDSPNHRAAAEWIMKRLESYGLQNVHLEPWGPFGNSWQFKKFYGALVEPVYAPLIGFPLAWTSSTYGPVTGEAVLAPILSEADLTKYKGQLKGKIVLIADPKPISVLSEPEFRRFSDVEIQARTLVPDPSQLPSGFGGCQQNPPATNLGHHYSEAEVASWVEKARKWRNERNRFLTEEGVLVAVVASQRGQGGTVTGEAGGSEDPNDAPAPPMVVLAAEHYNRIVRLIQHGIAPKLTFDIQADTYKNDQMGFNVIGEIPGTTKKDEIVMLGAHLDSWQGGTGATDDGSGVAVAMEAVRILSQLHHPLARTVRIALWGGEEQGLFGSLFYVQHHFAARDTMKKTAEYPKLDAYFHQDYGAGRYRAVWADGNDEIASIFRQWAAPIRDLEFEAVAGATAWPVRGPGGVDATSFLSIGLDAFTFMQDPLECAYRSAHTNMDVYDRVPTGDVMQSSAIMAWFVYNAASRTSMLPRIEAPAPLTTIK